MMVFLLVSFEHRPQKGTLKRHTQMVQLPQQFVSPKVLSHRMALHVASSQEPMRGWNGPFKYAAHTCDTFPQVRHLTRILDAPLKLVPAKRLRPKIHVEPGTHVSARGHDARIGALCP